MQNDDDYLSHMQAAKERDEEYDRQVIPSNVRPVDNQFCYLISANSIVKKEIQ